MAGANSALSEQLEKNNKMAPNQGPSPLVKDCDKNVARAEKLRPEYAPPDVVPEGLIRVENKLYSVEELAKMHPGGPVFVRVSKLTAQDMGGSP